MPLELIPGRTYRRLDLHVEFNGQRYGGISTPKRSPIIMLFTGEQGVQHGYHDGFQEDGTYWYTGEGQEGDMQMIKGNLAIFTHAQRGKLLHLFEYVKKGEVRYWGRALYLDHHEDYAPDTNGNIRKVIVFELYVDQGERGEPTTLIDAREEEAPVRMWRQPIHKLRADLFAEAERLAELPDSPAERKRLVYTRSAKLKVYIIRRANGVCEGCQQPAPFKTKKNEFYLEPHHIRRRSDGGPDHPLWVIALCPNCHARVHRGIDGGEYNTQLAKKVASIEGG